MTINHLQTTSDNYNVAHVITSVKESDFSDTYNCRFEYGSASLRSESSELKKIGKRGHNKPVTMCSASIEWK